MNKSQTFAGQFVKKKYVHLKDSRHKLKTPSMRTKDKAKSPKADCCDVITSKLLKQSQAREFKLPLLPSHLSNIRGRKMPYIS